MGGKSHKLLLLAMTSIALLALATGCGSGSSSSSSSSGSVNEDASGDVSAEFLRPKSANNEFVKFGVEAPTSEREAASKVLEENLRARQAADFATQCATLDAKTVEGTAGPSKKGNAAAAACPAALKALAEPLKSTKKPRADTLDAPIAVLRVKGNTAYALFHGSDKRDYAMPMVKEGGDWKVGSLLATELG